MLSHKIFKHKKCFMVKRPHDWIQYVWPISHLPRSHEFVNYLGEFSEESIRLPFDVNVSESLI